MLLALGSWKGLQTDRWTFGRQGNGSRDPKGMVRDAP